MTQEKLLFVGMFGKLHRIRRTERASLHNSLRQRQFRLLVVAPIEAGNTANALYELRMRAFGKLGDLRSAGSAIVAAEFYLDQLVMIQRAGEFLEQRRRQPLIAGHDYWLQVVCEAAQVALLSRGQAHLKLGCVKALQGIMTPCSITRRSVARSKSSARWLKEHFSDPFVKRAQAEGWRSRAVFKLEELIDRDRLLKPGMVVVDLGAAPGSWSQMVRERLRDAGRIVALDILPMQGIGGVEFIEGDFREDTVLRQLEAVLNGTKVDLVLSDMAPNMTGVDTVDQARAMHLAELAQGFSSVHLKPGGAFLVKLF